MTDTNTTNQTPTNLTKIRNTLKSCVKDGMSLLIQTIAKIEANLQNIEVEQSTADSPPKTAEPTVETVVEEEEEDVCPICQDPLPEDCHTTPCGHKHCRPCIQQWTSGGGSRHRKCPVCRANIHVQPSVPSTRVTGDHNNTARASSEFDSAFYQSNRNNIRAEFDSTFFERNTNACQRLCIAERQTFESDPNWRYMHDILMRRRANIRAKVQRAIRVIEFRTTTHVVFPQRLFRSRATKTDLVPALLNYFYLGQGQEDRSCRWIDELQRFSLVFNGHIKGSERTGFRLT